MIHWSLIKADERMRTARYIWSQRNLKTYYKERARFRRDLVAWRVLFSVVFFITGTSAAIAGYYFAMIMLIGASVITAWMAKQASKQILLDAAKVMGQDEMIDQALRECRALEMLMDYGARGRDPLALIQAFSRGEQLEIAFELGVIDRHTKAPEEKILAYVTNSCRAYVKA